MSITTIASLNSDLGGAPRAALVQAPDWFLWGAAWQRGPMRLDGPDGASCSSTDLFDTPFQKQACPGTAFRVRPDGRGSK